MQQGQNFRHVTRGGLRFERCPKSWIRDEAREASQFVGDFAFLDRFNVLPNEGGRLDQCPRFLEAIDVIEIARSEAQSAAQKRADIKNKAKRGRRGR